MAHIIGRVIRGDNIGGKQGYPTANLSRRVLVGKRLARGVYVAEAKLAEKWHQALVIIGVPGVQKKSKGKVEVYFIGYGGKLYGKRICVKVLKRLRKIKQFKRQQDLIKQIRQDIGQAKKYFK